MASNPNQHQGVHKTKNEMLTFAKQRKSQFEEGKPLHFHSLTSMEEATALVEAAQKEVEDVELEVSPKGQPTLW